MHGATIERSFCSVIASKVTSRLAASALALSYRRAGGASARPHEAAPGDARRRDRARGRADDRRRLPSLPVMQKGAVVGVLAIRDLMRGVFRGPRVARRLGRRGATAADAVATGGRIATVGCHAGA